jgi:UDP-N-acetylmuramoyl-tripeptide--D-alanyl-D-alanine ligase
MNSLWTIEAMVVAMRAERRGRLPAAISGLSIDTRTLQPGDAFFAIKGENRDGHAFVAAALTRGAGLAVVSEIPANVPPDAPLLVVDDVLGALGDLARAARARSQARIVGVTGSVGKTGTKEALRLVLSAQGETHASAASYNNHWGVPLSLARMPESAAYAIFEMGMNHAGEIAPLAQMVRPHVVVITTIEPVHLENLGSLEAIADAKAEAFTGLEPDGAAVINRDTPLFGRLAQRATEAGVRRIVSFGTHEAADARLIDAAVQPEGSGVRATVLGTELTYKVGAPGRHVVLNSLGVLAAASLVGADLTRAALELAKLEPPTGRGRRTTLGLAGGEALLIDESYNANPASMRAALALLGQAPVGNGGRRIAVLGDMLELGPAARALHADLSEAVIANGIDLVYCAGPLMEALWQALPPAQRGAHAADSAALEPIVIAGLRAGDALMVKGSLGSRMGPIVKALQQRFPLHAPEDASVQG